MADTAADVTIDCGDHRPESHDASSPAVVFEVLSPSTAWADFHYKLRDYDRMCSIKHYVVVWQDEMKAVVWTRQEGGHLVAGQELTAAEAVLALDAVGVALRLDEIYDRTGLSGRT